MFEPAYIQLLASGELKRRAQMAVENLADCTGCARYCRVNRKTGELGKCLTGVLPRLSSYGPHLGEENPLRGWRGSGTIFFSRCNLRCQYCQNASISQTDAGEEVEPEDLARVMLELQEMGCHNINFVSPSHVSAAIISAVLIAAQGGVRLPLVYNTGGYDSPETLALLDGIIDIYMPDMKYASAEAGQRYSFIENYPQVNRNAVRIMHRQVGDLQIDDQGLALRGLLVRHLVLPGNLAGTDEIVRFLASEISKDTYLNVMDQYRPAYHAHQYPQLNRPITSQEYRQAVSLAKAAGLHRLDH